MGGGDENRPKRCHTHRLDHRYIFFSFFDTNLFFNVYIGSLQVVYGLGGLHWMGMTKSGPNDARCIVWAIGTFLSFFFLILTYFIMSI